MERKYVQHNESVFSTSRSLAVDHLRTVRNEKDEILLGRIHSSTISELRMRNEVKMGKEMKDDAVNGRTK